MRGFEIHIVPFSERKRQTCRGFIREGIDDDCRDNYVICIDSALSPETQKHVLKHELAHMLLGHVETVWIRDKQAEIEAEEKARSMTDDELKAIIRMATKVIER